jgi:hypothetical protein
VDKVVVEMVLLILHKMVLPILAVVLVVLNVVLETSLEHQADLVLLLLATQFKDIT